MLNFGRLRRRRTPKQGFYADPPRPKSQASHSRGVMTFKKTTTVSAAAMRAAVADDDVPLMQSDVVLSADNFMAGGGSSGSGGGFGGSGGLGGGRSGGTQNSRWAPVIDDLGRGTVAEDWIPIDPMRQNLMFRTMFSRGFVEGPVVETISELAWGNFSFTGIEDKVVLDTYQAALEMVNLPAYMPFLSIEHLVIGRAIPQLILDPTLGIWRSMIIHDSDYVRVGNAYMTGMTPTLDIIPTPGLQEWARSTDPRIVEQRKGVPEKMLADFRGSKAIPLDPEITGYLPRRSSWGDTQGTSFFVRNIPLYAFEKGLINATLTGYRRRSGPIMHIAVGTDNFEPDLQYMEDIGRQYTATEEDSVSSTIVTKPDVQFNQIRGGLQEMWKWSDEISFLQDYRYRMFGVSDTIMSGEFQMDTSQAASMFQQRLLAHRSYITEVFIIQKFCRTLANLHGFKKRSKAELEHRIRIKGGTEELNLPTVMFDRLLDSSPDTGRADLLDRLEARGLPVQSREWNAALGGGDFDARMRAGVQEAERSIQQMTLAAILRRMKKINSGEEEMSIDDVEKEAESLLERLAKFGKNITKDEALGIVQMSEKTKDKAEELADGEFVAPPASAPATVSSAAYHPRDTKVRGTPEQDALVDRSMQNRDPHTLERKNRAF